MNQNLSGERSLLLRAERFSFCSVESEQQKIEIAGQVLVPNPDTAYVEFYMAHCFPVTTNLRTGFLPQVIANSYQSLNHKVFNLGHLMKKYNPEKIPRDRMLGTVVAVEFPTMPEGGWQVTADRGCAPGIRAVAVMHKAAENVLDILADWFVGDRQMDSVSMENAFTAKNGGFLVAGRAGVESFAETTPSDLQALGYVYVPAADAPELLYGCLNTEDDDRRDGMTYGRICRSFHGQEVIFLLGGLNGSIRFRGVGLTPSGGAREAEARVSTMMAGEELIDLKEVFHPLMTWLD